MTLLWRRAWDEEQLPRMRCTVGESVSQPVRLRNPLSVPVSLRAAVLNERNFAVAPRQLDLGPHESGEVLLEYTPSSVEEEEAGTVRFSHPEAGEFVYNVVGSGSAPGEMTPVMVTAPVGTSITHAFAFRNPFPRPIGVAASLDLVGGAGDATGRRELALLTRKARWTVEPFASVQLPLMFNPSRIAEQRATLVVAAGAEGLEWRYPVFAVAEASASGQTYEIRGRCREATEGVLAVRLPDVGALEAETAFDVEVVVPPEARSATDRCLRVEGQKTTLGPGEDTLRVAFLLAPMRPFECAAQMLVTRRTGGRWRFDVKLVAEAAAVDDVIVVEAAIKRTASVAFPLTNNVSAEAPFEAFFTPDSPIELSVFPAQGVLPPLGQPGTNVVVSFTPREYGKTLVGKLVIRTEEMQWTYEVRGRPPTYTAPQGEARVDARIDEGATERLRHHRARNHMQANMRVGQGTPSARRR